MTNIILESIVKEKGKYILAAATSGAGVVAEQSPIPEPTYLDTFLVWLPHMAVFAGFLLSLFALYKTYLDIKIARKKLSEKDE